VEGNVRLGCPWGCGANIIVMPVDLYDAIGKSSGVEGEVQFRQVVQQSVTPGGDRLAVMDPQRRITCPACDRAIQLPERGSTAPPQRA
jgi:hypothetical protein